MAIVPFGLSTLSEDTNLGMLNRIRNGSIRDDSGTRDGDSLVPLLIRRFVPQPSNFLACREHL